MQMSLTSVYNRHTNTCVIAISSAIAEFKTNNHPSGGKWTYLYELLI